MKLTEDIRLIVEICKLYYEGDISQKEISYQMGISKPQVSRALAFARQNGLVSIQINNPFAVESRYEKQLIEKFGLRGALVVKIPAGSGTQIRDAMVQAARNKMDNYISRSNTVGLMSGKSIAYITDSVSVRNKKNIQFVPLVGGMGVAGADWHASYIARKLAEKTGGKYYLLNAPLVVRNPEARQMLEGEPEIQSVLALADECDMMILGVGEIAETATMVKSGALTQEDICELKKEGAVAAVACGFLDKDGEPLISDLTQRFIGTNIQEVRRCQNVVVVAFGDKKVKAISATLKSGIVHEIITTDETAVKLLGE